MSKMRELANSPRGRMARTQQDLLKIASDDSLMASGELEHPVCQHGFTTLGTNGLERMTPEEFRTTVMTILKMKPSAHMIDVVPEYDYSEEFIAKVAPEIYRWTIFEKADLFREHFLREPGMVGFKYQLHNIPIRGRPVGDKPSVSMSIYLVSQMPDIPSVPVSINVEYRRNF